MLYSAFFSNTQMCATTPLCTWKNICGNSKRIKNITTKTNHFKMFKNLNNNKGLLIQKYFKHDLKW